MRIAIIGTGFIADIHAQAIKAIGQELVIAVNRNKEKARLFAQKWAIPYFGTSVKEAIAKADCIHICTPPLSHYEIAKAAILKGKSIICEKPLCVNPKKAKELLELAQKKKVVHAVCFNVRFHEACFRAKTMIQETAFGQIRVIHGSYLQEFHILPDFFNWRHKAKEGGEMRTTTEIGSHWIDLVRFWTGLEIVSVSANFANFQPKRYLTEDGLMHSKRKKDSTIIEVQSEDTAIITFKFSNGAIGNVVLSEIAHGRKNQLHLEVTSNKQSIWWNNEQPYQLNIGEKSKGINIATNPFGGGFTDTFSAFFKAIYQDIEKGKISDKPIYSTFYDGYVNTKICAAVYESAVKEGIWVKIL